ncbi:glutamate decarboxylase 4 [Vitis vinifera]|nr:glutamate decarboxylase 4 [Vitis vinifera]|eukprot:XP_002285268.1 PREDICTED: glutamate decarboxylase 4 [Vitis vinifera]
MVLSVVQGCEEESSSVVSSVFASRYVQDPPPRYKMPEKSIPKEAAYQIVHDELLLDGLPRLNLATFVTTWMEPECDKLMAEAINKNYVDMDEYPVTTELQNRCVNMIAKLFNAPSADQTKQAVGVGTVGSSEAMMLAGLAFKKKWQNKRKAQKKPFDKPNIVTGANVQVCWEKFARYFEVELKEVKLREGYYVMDPVKAVEMVDENTICVAAILGSTFNGEFEDVKLLNTLLTQKNKRTGWDTPIHVDAASGGFVAPFLYPELEWDFRLPLVKSINVSGHKYGLVYAGVGWAIWRSKEELPEELIFHINYLGGDEPTFTLNFSKGSSQVIAQYYQFLRMGFEGYKKVMSNCMESARILREGLEKTGRFQIISKEKGVPVVAFAFKGNDRKNLAFGLSKALRNYGWIVPAYTMPANAENVTVLRVVVREDFGRQLVEKLLFHIGVALKEVTDAASSVPMIRLTVEMKADESEMNAGEGTLHIPAASVHWKHDKPETVDTQVPIMDGKTKGVC